MELKTLIDSIQLDLNNIYIGRDHTDYLVDTKCFDINPEDFLEFAKKDIKTNDLHGMVNALSNVKRSIDSQTAKIFHCLGIDKNEWNLRNYPPKRELLEQLGVVSPNILRKVVTSRNYLEHDYKSPELETVEDAIDIASLFIEASNKKLDVWANFWISNEEESYMNLENYLDIFFKPFEGVFRVVGYYDKKQIGEIIITNSNKEEYKSFLILAISWEMGKVSNELIQPLLRSIG